MSAHDFTIALRTLRRDRAYALLNGAGLAVALASCVLIALFVRDELAYDRHHDNAGRIVALGMENRFGRETSRGAATPYALGGALRDGVPGVEAVVRMTQGGAGGAFVLGETPDSRHEVGVVFAEPSVFRVFTVPAVAGDVRTALDAPGGAVLTAPTAERVFGTTDAVGRTFRVTSWGDTLSLTVRAVVAAPPAQSSVVYDVLAPVSTRLEADAETNWGASMYRTFALLRPGTEPAAVEAAANRLAQAAADDGENGRRFFTVPLTGLHLSDVSAKEGFSGSPLYLRLFSAVAGLILLLSGINYVNLATARGARRAREVGVRKALGAGRGELVGQFLAESVVLSAAAALVGVAAAALALPFFNETFGKRLSLAALDPSFWGALALAALAVGVAAGLYPAVYLSRFEPTHVLKGSGAPSRAGGEAFLAGTWLRRSLVVVQFAAAVGLLVMTGSVARQLDFVRATPLGFDADGLVVVSVESPALSAQTEALKAAFRASPAVASVAGTSGVPPRLYTSYAGPPDPARPDVELSYKTVDADADYARTLGLAMAAGRWFDPDRPSDAARGAVINETLARELGYPTAAAALGRTLTFGDGEDEVVGVVRDFHFAALREPIGAVALTPHRPAPWEVEAGDLAVRYPEVAVRLVPGREAEGLADLRTAWARFSPDVPLDTRVVADDLAEMYAAEANLVRVFGLFAGIAVVIAALGLAGLASYAAERRTKEIGVRRVLGASVRSVVGLLAREYVVLAAVGIAVATPLTVLAVQRWLDGFAYRAPIGAGLFVAAAAFALVLALVAVGGQALRAATASPSRSLRSE